MLKTFGRPRINFIKIVLFALAYRFVYKIFVYDVENAELFANLLQKPLKTIYVDSQAILLQNPVCC